MRGAFRICLLSVASQSALAAPPFSGTIFLDPDIITSSDPTTFSHTTYAGQGSRVMYDRRVNNWITVNAFLYDAAFNDGLSAEIQVNPEFGNTTAAAFEANDAPIFTDLPVPGFAFPAGGQFGIGARTGGESQRVVVDNVEILPR